MQEAPLVHVAIAPVTPDQCGVQMVLPLSHVEEVTIEWLRFMTGKVDGPALIERLRELTPGFADQALPIIQSCASFLQVLQESAF